VVKDDIQNDAQILGMGCGDEINQVLAGAEARVNVEKIFDRVSVIRVEMAPLP